MKKYVIDGVEINCKIIRKPIKNLYMEIKDDFVEIRCNRYVSDEYIKFFLKKHIKNIKTKQENSKYYFLFGEKFVKNDDVDIESVYKSKTPEIVLPLVEKYSKIMNLKPSKISFRFNKSRWGSCSYKNSITFNYYLVKLPIELIEYVVVHELAHIKHKNHQKEFWNLVEVYMPDYKKRVRKLRKLEREF